MNNIKLIADYWDSFKEIFPYSILRQYDDNINSSNLYLEVAADTTDTTDTAEIKKYNDFMCENIDKKFFYNQGDKLKTQETQLISLRHDTQMQRKRYQRCIYYVIYGDILVKYLESPLNIATYKIAEKTFETTNVKQGSYFVIQPYTYYQFIPLQRTLIYCLVLEENNNIYDKSSTIYYDSNTIINSLKKRKNTPNLMFLNAN